MSLWPFKEKKPRTRSVLTALRPCHCGEKMFSQPGVLDELVNCASCGAIYRIGWMVLKPVAEFQMVEESKKQE